MEINKLVMSIKKRPLMYVKEEKIGHGQSQCGKLEWWKDTLKEYMMSTGILSSAVDGIHGVCI